MDKRSLLAVFLSLLILIAYQVIVAHLYPQPQRPSSSQSKQAVGSQGGDSSLPQSPSEGQAVQKSEKMQQPLAETRLLDSVEHDITVENEVYVAVFSALGGRIKNFRLKHYPEEEGRNSPPLEMIRQGPRGELPLEVQIEGKGSVISDAGIPYEVSGSNITLRENEKASLEFRGKTSDGMSISKTFSFSGQTYGMTLELKIDGVPQNASSLALLWTRALDHSQTQSYGEHGPVALVGRTFIYEANSSVVKKERLIGPDRVRWAGYADTYFLSAIIPPEGETDSLLFSVTDGTVETKLSIPWNQQPVTYILYVGPKEFAALNAVHPSLDRAIDFGWSHFIARPLLSLLQLSHSFTGNYGIDIILLTILVKLAFLPLSTKSFKSMNDMKKIQPQLEQLREQYKDDREKLNKEMMELYRRHNINPLGGCLPMLVQLPVFIGLYQAFMHAIELRQAPFFGWIQDLSRPDRLGTVSLPFVEPPGIPVLTILMGGTMLLQQAMTPATGDPAQQKMMMVMPLIFTAMFINFPAGLVLYWLVNNVLSIAQQFAYNKGLV